MSDRPTPAVALIGCGRLGSAILEGWLKTGTVDPSNLLILTPSAKREADAALAQGARVNPPLDALNQAEAIVLAVKPAKWREALVPLVPHLSPDGVIVSVMAGVAAADIAAMAVRPVARVMPTTAVAQAKGVAALWSAQADAKTTASRLFSRIADVVELPEEALIDPATAVAGSAPAFIYAFVQALAAAGEGQGLSSEAADRLARGALRSAGAGVETDAALQALIDRIASPGGTTRAGLEAMVEDGGLTRAADAAVKAAVARARSL